MRNDECADSANCGELSKRIFAAGGSRGSKCGGLASGGFKLSELSVGVK